MSVSRRSFLATSSTTIAAGTLLAHADEEKPASANADTESPTEPAEDTLAEEPKPVEPPKPPPVAEANIGFIGTGIRFHTSLGNGATEFGPCRKIADVDAAQAGRAWQKMMDRHREKEYPINMTVHEDYQDILDDKEINVVVIASPDHWHTKHVIDAVKAGKDIYCEKPLTLTIAESKIIEDAVEQSGQIVQIGTQQRTEMESRFVKAAAMAREGRVGKISKMTVCIGGSREAVELPKVDPPKHLNWDKYLGQCPMVDYREAPTISDTKGWGAGHPFSRAHHYYRWWYEYSGGKLTDWGAHHVDIAMLALDKLGDDVGPITIEPVSVTHPVEFVDGYPVQDDRFNAATKFHVRVTFADGLVMDVRDNATEDLGFDNGIMFHGETGRYLVNRGKLVGKPVEELEKNPLSDDPFQIVYGRPKPISHMRHFFECVESREQPISDVKSHNAMLNVCHGVNIAMRLGKTITYDPATRLFVNDPVANEFVARSHRDGYEFS